MHPKWNKKVTLDLDQLKATLKKSFCIPKRNISTVSISYLFTRHFVFQTQDFFFFFFFHCGLIVGKNTRPSCTYLLNVNMFHLEKEETRLVLNSASFPSPCVNWTRDSRLLCIAPRGVTRRDASSIHARRRKTCAVQDEPGFFFFQVKHDHV